MLRAGIGDEGMVPVAKAVARKAGVVNLVLSANLISDAVILKIRNVNYDTSQRCEQNEHRSETKRI